MFAGQAGILPIMRLYKNGVFYHATLHSRQADLPFLFLLHGFMGSSSVFDHLIESLKDVCNPVTVDLAGHGQSDKPADPGRYQSRVQTDDLSSVISRITSERVIVYGYSMGGRLALQLAADHPEKISSLILESTHCGWDEEEKREERIRDDEQKASQIESDFDAFLDGWKQNPLFAGTLPELARKYDAIARNQSREAMAASLRGFGTGVMPPVYSRLDKLNLPVLLISGESDQKFTDIHQLMAERLRDSVCRIIPGASHRVHASQPERIIKEIKHFISN
jgi:2-succinyl-6-hydroxy-2,4-cyclohexadiene-1-carboxylate synthase